MYAGADRRTDTDRRQVISEMSREEMIAELLTDTLSGVGSRRAYEERKGRKVIYTALVDLDGLKWVNDNWSHAAGDAMIAKVGRSLKAMGADVYRIGGDEFAVCFNTFHEASTFLLLAESMVSRQSFKWMSEDGQEMEAIGTRFTVGIGNSEDKADAMLKTMKDIRATIGIRAERGDTPPGLRLINNRVPVFKGGMKAILQGV
jgi:diguanylate cyclase (GGDEF)-like protein